MQNRNPRFDPKDGENPATGGVSVPTKGDSSSSAGVDPDATLIEFPRPASDPILQHDPLDHDLVKNDLLKNDLLKNDLPTQIDLGTPPPGTTVRRSIQVHVNVTVLQPGDVLGGRYEILQLLGEGGMGSVYKAMDRELNRPVALKLIRPEMASNPSILARFKQELLLAHQVTHKNVIRIYDFGDADGVKFITMEFVDGEDLRSLILKRKKFPPEEAVEVVQQVCRALEAAHNVGVIHRDLKPQNIMRDTTGRILVMDFGLARTLGGDGMTQTGALVGTMEYMSPEQALAKDLDQRSDLYTLGLILYELLAGVTPFHAESAVASLIKRNSERAAPISDHDASLPRALSNIVSKCLERDPALRYQSAGDLLRDLDAWQGKRAAATFDLQPAVEPWGRTIHWPLLSGIAAVVILAIVGYVFRGPLFSPVKKTASGPAVSMAILPFRNASGDSSLDWLGSSLSDMLSTDVGQSSQLRTVSQDRIHQILSDLRVAPNSNVEPATLRRLAEFTSADTLVWGQFTRVGSQIRIDATVQDLKHDRMVPIKIENVDEKDIPGAVDRFAASVRENLAFSEDALKELKASSFQPSSHSAAALRDYNQGVQFLAEGKNLDAVKALQSSTKEDSEFALAFSRLADADSALGYDTDAEQASRRSVDLSEQLPAAEKYLIQAAHARIVKDNKKAIDAYENLARTMTDNPDIESALAGLYTETGNYDAARTHLTKLLSADAKSIKALWQMGVLEIVSGNAQAALDPLSKGLSLAVQTDSPELKALILQSIGISYRMMNKSDEAMRNYQDAMAINQRLGLKRALASNLVEMAVVQNAQGKVDAALSDYDQALKLQREIGMKKEVGDTLIDMGVVYESKGDYDKALGNYKESLQIQRDSGDENYQALCLNNIGGVYLGKGDTDNALTYLQQALALREKLNVPAGIAETLSELAQVYIHTGLYDQALATSMRALDLSRKAGNTRGAAEDSHDIGLIFEYQGRFGAAINSMQDAANGYRNVGDRSTDTVEVLNDLSDALAQAGRAAESDPPLREAQGIAHDLKNEGIQAELLTTQADVRKYAGDGSAAGTLYQQALQAALRGKDEEQILVCRLHAAEIGISKSPDAAVRELRKIQQQADSRNLKYVSLESSVNAAEALINRKAYGDARQELQSGLEKSEKLGARYQTARIQFLLGKSFRLSGSADSATHYAQAKNLLDDMSKDPGAEKLLTRSDLKAMSAEAAQFAAPTH
ncbi:MAG TPA: tetratricopeptide repeat protein [Candidatus Binatia bacterium]|nr:tetratricopeptide repeat protein [Candidatus Binatia bacterium]